MKRKDMVGKIAKKCWQEKEQYNWMNKYGIGKVRRRVLGKWKERREMEMELISRERATQRQEEENRILKAKYNKRYKDINMHGRGPKTKYLWEKNLDKLGKGEVVRALLKLITVRSSK